MKSRAAMVGRQPVRSTGTVLLMLVAACTGPTPLGSVQLNELSVEGDVDADYLAPQLAQLDPWLQACYVRTLRRDRQAEGTIRLTMQGSGGKLVAQIVHNETGSDDLGSCLSAQIEALTILEPEDVAPWSYTAEWSVTFAIVPRP